MDNLIVAMQRQEWNQLLFILANAEGKGINWSTTNPLVMKIGEQLNAQSQRAAPTEQPSEGKGNGQEKRL